MADRLAPDGSLRPLSRPDAPGPLRPQARPGALGEVPAEVAEAATVEGALPLGRTALLGLLSGPEGRAALLRLPSGRVVRAATGDVVGGAVVASIAEDRLLLWRDGAHEVLTIPA